MLSIQYEIVLNSLRRALFVYAFTGILQNSTPVEENQKRNVSFSNKKNDRLHRRVKNVSNIATLILFVASHFIIYKSRVCNCRISVSQSPQAMKFNLPMKTMTLD